MRRSFVHGRQVGRLCSEHYTTIKRSKYAEELLNGSVALLQQLGLEKRAAEGTIELALCYQRQGLFDMGHSTVLRVLNDLGEETTSYSALR